MQITQSVLSLIFLHSRKSDFRESRLSLHDAPSLATLPDIGRATFGKINSARDNDFTNYVTYITVNDSQLCHYLNTIKYQQWVGMRRTLCGH